MLKKYGLESGFLESIRQSAVSGRRHRLEYGWLTYACDEASRAYDRGSRMSPTRAARSNGLYIETDGTLTFPATSDGKITTSKYKLNGGYMIVPIRPDTGRCVDDIWSS